jgi:transcriptional regulator with GAF, ATPase, and Fis domain
VSADPSELLEQARALARAAREAGCLEAVLAELGREPAAEQDCEDAAAPQGLVTCQAQPLTHGFVGKSPQMQEVYRLLDRVAPTDVTLLVLGETGTGKELVARALHGGSRRAKKALLAENCAAVPAELLESELFGHAKGAFTGAIKDRDGHFVAADGGTVFLDEIGDMPLPMQAKLLRVLQEGEVRPVGSNRTQKVDVRVVAATNKDLEAGCREGWFREDLYWRLAVMTLRLPPLRERVGDAARLAEHFFARECGALGREPLVEEGVLEELGARPWPGNVRELENEVRRAVALSSGAVRVSDLSPRPAGA